MITVSLVSHNHGDMILDLVRQLQACDAVSKIIVTFNTRQDADVGEHGKVECLVNAQPKGFGANHNFAFSRCETDFFCVINPDITLEPAVFPALLSCFSDRRVALAAPLVTNGDGVPEDSIRRFPSPLGLFMKLATGVRGIHAVTPGTGQFEPDWVAGMFMLFRSQGYRAVRGFDEGFFLYYEDVDICARLHEAGLKIVVCTQTSVIHDAQRASWRHWGHRRMHLASMARYFTRNWRRLYPAAMRRGGGSP